jgi:hypothetical protein
MSARDFRMNKNTTVNNSGGKVGPPAATLHGKTPATPDGGSEEVVVKAVKSMPFKNDGGAATIGDEPVRLKKFSEQKDVQKKPAEQKRPKKTKVVGRRSPETQSEEVAKEYSDKLREDEKDEK